MHKVFFWKIRPSPAQAASKYILLFRTTLRASSKKKIQRACFFSLLESADIHLILSIGKFGRWANSLEANGLIFVDYQVLADTLTGDEG